jgi:cob(I)alamin adenosyltransferase
MDKGGIHIYTGHGKGKTTAAVGLCVRARSRGLRVLFTQFMKNIKGGEVELLEELSVRVLRFEGVLSPLFHPGVDMQAVRAEALKALGSLKPVLKDYDLVVLDEFTHLLATGLIGKEEALAFIGERPGPLDMALTGRDAPDWLIDLAEDVTEMKEIKHPASKGKKARKGIEF